ncbi:XRE family transcriptional regulator [Nocardiopsis sp. N85]|uniref:helix-turn-helix domain-containing protein n=1 Tax=Nocardiopsis sp. N85 TaxID=3029400 RepID=UPI00237F10D6|nr:XRE family transcriptional regulator [Nocardiopsis sp. N85]MDE3722845.1 XRE family transcriptional regulator [Nocardiopsis sp. N85]
MDKLALGKRIAEAREDAGMTQEDVGLAVGLDRSAISRLEKGERKLSVPELVAVANTLGRPLAYFVSDPVPSVVSRRRGTAQVHDTTRTLDTELEQFAADVRSCIEMRLLTPVERHPRACTPQDHETSEQMAGETRRRLDLNDAPVRDLGAACERLGLYTYSVPLGKNGPDGGCVEVGDASRTLGVAVINGDAPHGRRRMTLAHELGHWLCGDAYDAQATAVSERMINSFAIHFLAPRAGVHAVWREHAHWSVRDRALAVGASFRLSWSAAIGQLRNLGLIGQDEHGSLGREEPRSGDYLRLALSWDNELSSPYVSPGYASACVNGYTSGRLTADRTVELMRGTLSVDELPRRNVPSLDDLRRSFAGHDD